MSAIIAATTVTALGGAYAADEASDAQVTASNNANDTQWRMYEQSRADQAQSQWLGNQASNQMAALLGLPQYSQPNPSGNGQYLDVNGVPLPPEGSPTGTIGPNGQFISGPPLAYPAGIKGAMYANASAGSIPRKTQNTSAASFNNFQESAPYTAAEYTPTAAPYVQQEYQAPNAYEAPPEYQAPPDYQAPNAYQAKTGPAPYDWNQDPGYTKFNFEADPGYQFQLAEGMKGLEASQAARGGLLSGAALKAASRYNQNFAASAYASAYERDRQRQNERYGRNVYGEASQYNRYQNEEARDYSRYTTEENRAYDRQYNEEMRDYSRYTTEENQAYDRQKAEEKMAYDRYIYDDTTDYARYMAQENQDYARFTNSEINDYNRWLTADQTAYTRDYTADADYYNRLASLAGAGQVASGVNSAGALATGSAVASNQIGAGNAQAAGIVGTSNALTGALSTGLNYYQDQQYLDYLKTQKV